MPNEAEWKQEAMRLRTNHDNNSEAVRALVKLFETEITKVDSPLLCLALHHVALRFNKCAEKKTIKKMASADLEQLPEAIYSKSRIVKVCSECSQLHSADLPCPLLLV